MDVLKILGCWATDKATGSEGAVVSVSFDSSGCIMGLLATRAKDGDYKTLWFDVKRLEIGRRLLPAPQFVTPDKADGPEAKMPATPRA